MTSDYKHYDYMLNKEWVELEIIDLDVDNSFKTLMFKSKFSDYVSPTDKGIEKYYSVRNSWLKWILGTIISVATAVTLALLKLLSIAVIHIKLTLGMKSVNVIFL